MLWVWPGTGPGDQRSTGQSGSPTVARGRQSLGGSRHAAGTTTLGNGDAAVEGTSIADAKQERERECWREREICRPVHIPMMDEETTYNNKRTKKKTIVVSVVEACKKEEGEERRMMPLNAQIKGKNTTTLQIISIYVLRVRKRKPRCINAIPMVSVSTYSIP